MGEALVAALISGIGKGSMYGLVAIGYYVTFAVSGTVNFAQGACLMLGAVAAFLGTVRFGGPMLVVAPVALALCAGWSVVVERIAVRPFVRRRSESWLMGTVALGLIVENAVQFTFGKDPRGMSSPINAIG